MFCIESIWDRELNQLLRNFIDRLHQQYYPNENIEIAFKKITIKINEFTEDYINMTDTEKEDLFSFIRNDFINANTIEELEDIVRVQPPAKKYMLKHIIIRKNKNFDVQNIPNIKAKDNIIPIKSQKKSYKEKIKSFFIYNKKI